MHKDTHIYTMEGLGFASRMTSCIHDFEGFFPRKCVAKKIFFFFFMCNVSIGPDNG